MYICPKCHDSLTCIEGNVCVKCGKPLTDRIEYCTDCKKTFHLYDQGAGLYRYDAIRQSIYRIKYGGRREYLDYYADELVEHLGEQIRYWDADAIIGVPLHRKRLQKRGYNQADELARRIADKMKLPFYKNYVLRVKNTSPQKGLDANERQNNLKKAFIIGQNVVKLKTIIVVDDIYTTGSTMDAIADVLKSAGVEHVYFVTLAIAV
ncbi:MAG: ComF family protein [Lachnospiraceae bacterium]|nr:ComF family protein [Lachnospiraceae bacterium]